MIRGNKLSTTAIMAISAAFLCSSPASFAQETATIPTTQPATPAPVAEPLVVQTAPEVAPVSTTVAPPPAIRTIPDSALSQPVASSPSPRAAATPVQRQAPRRTAASQNAAGQSADAASATSAPVDTAVAPDFVPTSDNVVLGDVNLEETGAIAPLDQSPDPALSESTQDDWMVYGGIAAALGLAGLGGVVASRRRRNRQNEYRPIEPAMSAPALVSNSPIPRPMAADRPEPRIVQPAIVQPLVSNRDLPPVTDPLFAHQAELKPVTDPMFSQHIDMPPVTDPMFAEHNDYAGNSSAGSAFDKRRIWSATPGDQNSPIRELEPAE